MLKRNGKRREDTYAIVICLNECENFAQFYTHRVARFAAKARRTKSRNGGKLTQPVESPTIASDGSPLIRAPESASRVSHLLLFPRLLLFLFLPRENSQQNRSGERSSIVTRAPRCSARTSNARYRAARKTGTRNRQPRYERRTFVCLLATARNTSRFVHVAARQAHEIAGCRVRLFRDSVDVVCEQLDRNSRNRHNREARERRDVTHTRSRSESVERGDHFSSRNFDK